MTGRQFYDWQTAGGADDVMRMVDALERAELRWCAIDGIAVNHWAAEPMVTRDVDFVVAIDEIDRAVAALEAAGFEAERHDWSINFRGRSQVSLQLSTEDFYREFPTRPVPADVHGILLRVACLDDTVAGKIKAWRTPERRPSKVIKDLGDIARLVEAHPAVADPLPADAQAELAQAQRETEATVAELAKTQQKMLIRLDRLDGHMPEDKVAKNLPAFLGREFRRCRVLDRAERRTAALAEAGFAVIGILACESISPQPLAAARSRGLRVLTNGWLLPEAA